MGHTEHAQIYMERTETILSTCFEICPIEQMADIFYEYLNKSHTEHIHKTPQTHQGLNG